MSKLWRVLKDKNKVERRDKQRKREELVDLILSDDSVDKVVIEVPKNNTTKFMRAIYGEEMTQYNIIQIDESHFSIGLRLVNF